MLENAAYPVKQHIFMKKFATKLGMYSATHESVTVPIGRGRKIRTALRTNQIEGFVTVPSWKKNNDILYCTTVKS